MPTRSSLTVALTFATACGWGSAAAPAQPRDLVDAPAPSGVTRDLVPFPADKPGSPLKRPVVTLQPSSPVVRVGTPISFEVSSSIDGFGHLYVLSASGRVQVWMENVPIAAGERLVFPIGSLGIRAAAPAGREDLMLIVTKERIDGFVGRGVTRAPRTLDYDQQAFKRALTEKFIDLPRRHWGHARTSVQVVERAASAPGWGWDPGARPRPNLWTGQWDED